MFNLQPPRHISTLPESDGIAEILASAVSGRKRAHALEHDRRDA